ncbi:MAG: bifunctional demethylmenaquinone methyltransferase/2-methoxy-6-polyprenyl-1,4-benzoquinol methylase UbiE [Marinilabiliales bacterium]|nr:bifunctional demethylmenaquinone methyltransferase/2-methoxy-6-polyprenyl-1,4-benzoquinol methylase UbiE [Marinilabiliales bacterium]
MSEIKPYRDSDAGKKEQIASMFNSIAPKYDLLNHTLSFGIDHSWRKKAIRLIAGRKPALLLDVATGTGDFAIAALRSGAQKIIGIDISTEMIAVGKEKIRKLELQERIELKQGDSESIDFPADHFDCATVAFGVRNFENLGKGLSELHRVLKPGGSLCVLEFSKPRNPVVKWAYGFYSRYILPRLGRMVSGDKAAYTYLPESVEGFPDGKDFIAFMSGAGFVEIKEYRLTFGVATIYIGIKANADVKS